MTTVGPSISSSDVDSSSWDAIVIGAGCAGTTTALQLARGGAKRVLLADKSNFPRYKVCGCCIGRPLQLALESIGLGRLLAEQGAVPTNEFYVGAGNRHARVPLPEYYILSRERFDSALVRAAIEAGVHFRPGTNASLEAGNQDERVVRLKSGDAIATATCSIVVVADGLGSRLLRTTDDFVSNVTVSSRIGAGAVSTSAPEFYRPGVIYMACGDGGYVGSSRLEDGRLVVAAAFDTSYVKASCGLARAAAGILDEADFPAIPNCDSVAWKGTPELTRNPSAVAAHRAFVVGDAAGYVEPFTGEGMKWAVTSGIALAPIALKAIGRYDRIYEREWKDAHRRNVVGQTVLCKLLASALRHPALVKLAMRVLAAAPGIAAPFVRHLNAPRAAQKEVVL
jgi:flavin-dependent dehydrogenase